jgi:hypothetical protein
MRKTRVICSSGTVSSFERRGFIPITVYIGPEKVFCMLHMQFPGVAIDVGGRKDYAAKVDMKICRVKELYHAVKSGLPWNLPVS